MTSAAAGGDEQKARIKKTWLGKEVKLGPWVQACPQPLSREQVMQGLQQAREQDIEARKTYDKQVWLSQNSSGVPWPSASPPVDFVALGLCDEDNRTATVRYEKAEGRRKAKYAVHPHYGNPAGNDNPIFQDCPDSPDSDQWAGCVADWLEPHGIWRLRPGAEQKLSHQQVCFCPSDQVGRPCDEIKGSYGNCAAEGNLALCESLPQAMTEGSQPRAVCNDLRVAEGRTGAQHKLTLVMRHAIESGNVKLMQELLDSTPFSAVMLTESVGWKLPDDPAKVQQVADVLAPQVKEHEGLLNQWLSDDDKQRQRLAKLIAAAPSSGRAETLGYVQFF